MIFEALELAGAFRVVPTRLTDERGSFARTWCQEVAASHGVFADFVQSNTVTNALAGTVRGLHLQRAPHAEAKLVHCVRGASHHVLVDLRPESETYRHTTFVVLRAEVDARLFVPEGMAHGYQTLLDDTVLAYQMSDFHTPGAQARLAHDDTTLGIDWPLPVTVISDADRSAPMLDELTLRAHSNDAWLSVAGPTITGREVRYAATAARAGWNGDHSLFQTRFETRFAEHLGVAHAVSLPSCTSAIHLALAAAGVGPGHEVIVPELTWIATAAPIRYLGATPVFADVDPNTWCLSTETVRARLTDKTRAIIVVHLYGGMPPMAPLMELARRHGLFVLEDAAQAIGASQKGRAAGTWADASAFSFHGSKTLTTGEGGMLVTDDDELRDRALTLRDHGRAPGDKRFFNSEVAYKYKMSATQAAIGLAQVERVDELVARKRRLFELYRDELAGLPVALNPASPGVSPAYWMTTAVFDPSSGLDKETVGERLAEVGIDSRPFFHPLSSLPAFAQTASAQDASTQNVASYELSPWGINLPSGFALDAHDVRRVGDAVRRIIG